MNPEAEIKCPHCGGLVHLVVEINGHAPSKGKSDFNELFSAKDISDEVAREIEEATLKRCGPKGEGDVSDPAKWKYAWRWCDDFRKYFTDHKWWIPCRQLLLKMWDLCAEEQVRLAEQQIEAKTGKGAHVSRAWIADLARTLENDWGTSLDNQTHNAEVYRWTILEQADVFLDEIDSSKNPTGLPSMPATVGTNNQAGNARHWFKALGVSDTEIRLVKDLANECRESAGEKGWHGAEAFAEAILCKLCETAEGEALLMRFLKPENSPFGEFAMSLVYLRRLLQIANGPPTEAGNAKKNAGNQAQNQGKDLEVLATYLFLHFGGCIPRSGITDIDQVSQHDIVVSNYASGEGAFTSRFGQHFLVECKNTKEKVNSATVGYFLERLHLTHCRFGVLLSAEGITGDGHDDEKNARQMIRRAFHEHGVLCIVISFKDLAGLVPDEIGKEPRFPSVSSMLLRLANEFQFGKHTKRTKL